MFSLSALETKLVAYVNDAEAQEVAFDASEIPKISREQAKQENTRTSRLFNFIYYLRANFLFGYSTTAYNG